MHWMYQNGGWYGQDLFGFGTFPTFGIIPLVIWALAWKGWALWLAARRGEKIWFLILLVVNTLGILEIIYIFFIAKQSDIPEDVAKVEPIDRSKETVS